VGAAVTSRVLYLHFFGNPPLLHLRLLRSKFKQLQTSSCQLLLSREPSCLHCLQPADLTSLFTVLLPVLLVVLLLLVLPLPLLRLSAGRLLLQNGEQRHRRAQRSHSRRHRTHIHRRSS
jgi:hypothetical protein